MCKLIYQIPSYLLTDSISKSSNGPLAVSNSIAVPNVNSLSRVTKESESGNNSQSWTTSLYN